MKIIIFLFFLVLSSPIYAQVESSPPFYGRTQINAQTGSGVGYWEIAGTFFDQTGFWDATSIQVGDIVFFSDAGVGYYLPVTVVVNTTSINYTVRINNTGITGVSMVPVTEGAIYTPSLHNLAPFISGITDPNQQTLLHNNVVNIETELKAVDEVAIYTASGPPPNSLNSIDGYFLAMGQDGDGPLYRWEVSDWVLVGGLRNFEQYYTATSNQTIFNISGYTPIAPAGGVYPISVYRNGVKLRYVASGPTVNQFSYSGATVTLAACRLNDEITITFNN